MKRVSGRAVIFINDEVILLFRRRIKDNETREYYAIPGGGKEENETIEECVVREIKEEYGTDIKLGEYLGKVEDDKNIGYLYHATIINGEPKLGGEELERNTKENYYEVQRININDLDKYPILEENKKLIRKAYEIEKNIHEK